MIVPTIITPGEWIVLINPLHPQFSMTWIVSGPDAYAFDARLAEPSKIVDKKWTWTLPPSVSH